MYEYFACDLGIYEAPAVTCCSIRRDFLHSIFFILFSNTEPGFVLRKIKLEILPLSCSKITFQVPLQ